MTLYDDIVSSAIISIPQMVYGILNATNPADYAKVTSVFAVSISG